MNGYLIDTNILSEYSRQDGPNPGVKHWLENVDLSMQYVSVLSLAEIKKGVELLAEGKRRNQLENWLKQDLEFWFTGRVLPVDRRVADRWASLTAEGLRFGKPLPIVDSMIAATALAFDLIVATRNTRDFKNAGVRTINPWQIV